MEEQIERDMSYQKNLEEQNAKFLKEKNDLALQLQLEREENEKFGKEKGCTFATVNTMDWEALGFYKRQGFTIEFERHGFKKESVFYFLRKPLL